MWNPYLLSHFSSSYTFFMRSKTRIRRPDRYLSPLVSIHFSSFNETSYIPEKQTAMFFNKSALLALATIVTSLGSAAAQNSFRGVGEILLLVITLNFSQLFYNYCLGCRFDRDNLPADFTPCGGNCPPPSPDTLPIALPSTLFNGADSCCSTFTITCMYFAQCSYLFSLT
jgi:hypothetical protein